MGGSSTLLIKIKARIQISKYLHKNKNIFLKTFLQYGNKMTCYLDVVKAIIVSMRMWPMKPSSLEPI